MKFNRKFESFILPFFTILVYLFIYMPVIVLIIFSFNKSALGYNWTGFTLDWFYQLFYASKIWKSLLNSLVVGFCAVTFSLIMGTLFIWGINSKYKFLISLFYTTISIPDVVIAAGLLTFFTILSIPLGLITLIVGHTLLGLGLVIPIVYARYNELDNGIIEASLNLGASEWQTFTKIILPFLKPALISASVSVFILSFDDFLISFFCSSSTSQTLSLYIFSLIRAGVSPIINALSTLILLISILFVIIITLFQIKTDRPKL